MGLTKDQIEYLILNYRVISKPAKSVADLIERFSDSVVKIISPGDRFYLSKIEHFDKASAACICGRSIKHRYIIRHVSKELEIGLGSECMKYFFESQSVLKLEKDLKKFEDFCASVEEALDEGLIDEQLLVLEAYHHKKNTFTKKEMKRLKFGLPLTKVEYQNLVNRINADTKAIESVLDTLVKPYLEFATLEDRQYIMGVLEDGFHIYTADDLKGVSLGDLASQIRPFMKQRTRESMTKGSNITEEKALEEDTIDPELVAHVITALTLISDSELKLSKTSKTEFRELRRNLDALKALDQNLYLKMLVHKETRIILQAHLNQLDIRLNLYKVV